ncbi:MAG: hypothetical protein ABIS23_02970 [Sphingomicrobium sp.]
MNRLTPMLAVAAVLLSGCNQEDHTIVAGGPQDDDAAAAALQANGPIALPPSISATKTYRCGNSIFHVNWMSDGKSATIRTEQNGSPVLVTATEDGQPMTAASGHAISGTASDASVRITLPGGAAQSCTA